MKPVVCLAQNTRYPYELHIVKTKTKTMFIRKQGVQGHQITFRPVNHKIFNLADIILELAFLFTELTLTVMNQREPLGDPLLESGVNLNIGLGACQPELR